MELTSIISLCKNKSLKDQKILYEYTYQELYNVCLRYTNNSHDAQDVFNLSMLKIFQHIIDSNKEINNYLGFSTKILRCTAIDYYRKSISPILYNSDYMHENMDDGYLDNAFNKIEIEEIFSVIQGLPHKERIVFSMFEIDGFTHKEIANELNINENHSKWLLHNAKKILKEKLIKQGIKSYTI
jgi:RNA polymerase sigma-70 factor (ECF subfamily)